MSSRTMTKMSRGNNIRLRELQRAQVQSALPSSGPSHLSKIHSLNQASVPSKSSSTILPILVNRQQNVAKGFRRVTLLKTLTRESISAWTLTSRNLDLPMSTMAIVKMLVDCVVLTIPVLCRNTNCRTRPLNTREDGAHYWPAKHLKG